MEKKPNDIALPVLNQWWLLPGFYLLITFNILCNYGETIYVLLVFPIYCIFNWDIPHLFLYVTNVKRTHSLWSFLITFTKYPAKSEIAGQRDWINSYKYVPWPMGKCSEKNEGKFSNQLIETHPWSNILVKMQVLIPQFY